jgi:hypothetical protein
MLDFIGRCRCKFILIPCHVMNLVPNLGEFTVSSANRFFWIFLMDHLAVCVTSSRLKLLALDGTLHWWEQIKVTRTYGRIVGRICLSFPLPPSLRYFTGLATGQCALSCGTSGWEHIMKCIFFCFTARCRWFSRNLMQYFAVTVWPFQTLCYQ